jgi:hypothetical protein
MSRLQFLLFVILLNVSSTSQERLCKYKQSGAFCLKHCCGKPDDTLLCLDSCDGIPCSKSDDCDDDGCCNSGKCTNSGCKTPWYVIATPVLVIVVAVFIAAYRIWWVKNRRVSHAGMIYTVICIQYIRFENYATRPKVAKVSMIKIDLVQSMLWLFKIKSVSCQRTGIEITHQLC